MTNRFFNFLTFLRNPVLLDTFTHVSMLMGTFTVLVLTVSSFTFFLYLYQPVFSEVDSVFLVNPSINYELLIHASRELEKRQGVIEAKLQQAYRDPFQ
ncbi:MAG: hypothetical protein HY001_01255 [Candidatus Portnoybacteria bacterium]|nr:hypothetical protein [Candidatus Portnoybacteria bacterium]